MNNCIKIVLVLPLVSGCIENQALKSYHEYSKASDNLLKIQLKSIEEETDRKIKEGNDISDNLVNSIQFNTQKYKLNSNNEVNDPVLIDKLNSLVINPEYFDQTYKISKNLCTTLDSGLSYAGFNEIISQYLTELSVARDFVDRADDRYLLELYSDSGGLLNNTKLFWQNSIKNSLTGEMKRKSDSIVFSTLDMSCKIIHEANKVYVSNHHVKFKKASKTMKNKKYIDNTTVH